MRPARRLFRRYGDRWPEPARRFVRLARDLRVGRATVGLPRCARALCIAPHPDDESIGCGGTIALLADGGTDVTVAIATDGEGVASRARRPASEISAVRRGEATEALAVLGIGPPRFLGLADGGLERSLEELARHVSSLADELAPDVLFIPWFLEDHPDHRAVGGALAMVPSLDVEVWAYEVWTPLWANRLVDITSAVDRKRSAIAAHRADPKVSPDPAIGLNRYRASTGLVDGDHAEAFLVAPVDRYLALI